MLDLSKKKTFPNEVVAYLVVQFDLSARQVYRCLQHAQSVAKPLALRQPKAVLTVKLP